MFYECEFVLNGRAVESSAIIQLSIAKIKLLPDLYEKG